MSLTLFCLEQSRKDSLGPTEDTRERESERESHNDYGFSKE